LTPFVLYFVPFFNLIANINMKFPEAGSFSRFFADRQRDLGLGCRHVRSIAHE